MAHVIPFHGTFITPRPSAMSVRWSRLPTILSTVLCKRPCMIDIRTTSSVWNLGMNSRAIVRQPTNIPRRSCAEGLAESRRVAPRLPAGHLLPHDRIPTALFGARHPDEAVQRIPLDGRAGRIRLRENLPTREHARRGQNGSAQSVGSLSRELQPDHFSLLGPAERHSHLIEQAITAEKPRIDFQDDVGFRQRLWSVTDRGVLEKVVQVMKTKLLFIADGHHRYETALNYRRARRQQPGVPSTPQPYDNVLMLFASLEDKGLTVLPTHRVLTTPVPAAAELLHRLEPVFEVAPLRFQPANEPQVRGQFIETLRSRGQSVPMFGLALQNDRQYYLLTLKTAHRPSATASPRDRLDVSLLQQHVVATLCPTQQEQEAILYSKDDHEALNWVRQGTGTAALLLNPTKVAEVQAVASAGERMPHKSTYFFPKPLTGLVMNVMEG